MLTKQVMLTGAITLAGALGIGVCMQAAEPAIRLRRMMKPL